VWTTLEEASNKHFKETAPRNPHFTAFLKTGCERFFLDKFFAFLPSKVFLKFRFAAKC
jgi:hypothetical protein